VTLPWIAHMRYSLLVRHEVFTFGAHFHCWPSPPQEKNVPSLTFSAVSSAAVQRPSSCAVWSETMLFNEQIYNTHDERPLSLFAIPKTVKIMLFPKPVGRTARTSSSFCRLLTACLCSGFKTTFLSFDFKKSNARSIASPKLFCLTDLLLLCVTPNWRWFTVNRPIKMPRTPEDEVKICDSQKTGLISLPAPSPSLCHSPQTDSRTRPRWRCHSDLGYPRVLGIPIPKSLVKWVSRVGIPKTLILTLTKD